jgi:hypothetical protein
METKEYKGHNGTLILSDKTVTIKRGAKGFFFGGASLRGDKTFPYSSIAAVRIKKSGITEGCFEFSLIGGSEANIGLRNLKTDENTITFENWGNKKFVEAKELIEERMLNSKSGAYSGSGADELGKFAALRDKGVITEGEFQRRKKQLLESVSSV